MSLEQALSPLQHCQAPDISIKNAIVKCVRQIYEDMAAGGGIQSVVAGTAAETTGEAGDVTVAIDDTDPLNPVVNLSFAAA